MIVSLTGACTFNNVAINQEADNQDGKVFLNEVYKKISTKDFDEVDSLVGDSLKQLAGSHGISKLLKFINTKVGSYKNYKIPISRSFVTSP